MNVLRTTELALKNSEDGKLHNLHILPQEEKEGTSSSGNLGISNATWLITSLICSVFSYSFWEEVGNKLHLNFTPTVGIISGQRVIWASRKSATSLLT